MHNERQNDTIAAIATPPGEGGIAIVRISGARAGEFLRAAFRPAHKGEMKHGQMRYGVLTDPTGAPIDEVMAVFFRAPRSYTREDVAEIHLHGGTMCARAAMERLLALGARAAEPGEFTYRAFMNGRVDLSEAEAIMGLIGARSQAARRASIRQLRGGVSAPIGRMREELTGLLAKIEAATDFPDEIDEDVTAKDVRDGASRIRDELSRAADGKRARIVRDGASVVLCGRPNVGKSSLMNALLSADRAIVTDIPGTTRDVLTESFEIGGVRYQLSDTAGIRETADAIEKIGVTRARDALRDADCVLLVLDSSAPLTPADQSMLANRDERYITVLNKSDLPPAAASATIAFPANAPGETSAPIVRNANESGETSAPIARTANELDTTFAFPANAPDAVSPSAAFDANEVDTASTSVARTANEVDTASTSVARTANEADTASTSVARAANEADTASTSVARAANEFGAISATIACSANTKAPDAAFVSVACTANAPSTASASVACTANESDTASASDACAANETHTTVAIVPGISPAKDTGTAAASVSPAKDTGTAVASVSPVSPAKDTGTAAPSVSLVSPAKDTGTAVPSIPREPIRASAKTGEGIDEILRAIEHVCRQNGASEDQMTLPRHIECAHNAMQALDRAIRSIESSLPLDLCATDLREALAHLGDITGETMNEHVIDRVFSDFCVGK